MKYTGNRIMSTDDAESDKEKIASLENEIQELKASILPEQKLALAGSLDIALREGQVAIVAGLASSKYVDVNLSVRNNGLTLIHYALQGLQLVNSPELAFISDEIDTLELLEILVNRDDTDVNRPDPTGATPLVLAFKREKWSHVEKLLRRKDLVVEFSALQPFLENIWGPRPHPHTYQGNVRSILDYFISCHAMVSMGDMITTFSSREELEVNEPDKTGEYLIWTAIRNGKWQVVKGFLAQPTIKLDIQNEYGDLLLHLLTSNSVAWGDYQYYIDIVLAVVDALLKCDIDINQRCRAKGKLPFWAACEQGKLEIAWRLLEDKRFDLGHDDEGLACLINDDDGIVQCTAEQAVEVVTRVTAWEQQKYQPQCLAVAMAKKFLETDTLLPDGVIGVIMDFSAVVPCSSHRRNLSWTLQDQEYFWVDEQDPVLQRVKKFEERLEQFE